MSGNKSIPSLGEFERLILTGSEDFLRHSLERMLNLIMELEVEAKTNAVKHERTAERTAYRNGKRSRNLATGVGGSAASTSFVAASYYPALERVGWLTRHLIVQSGVNGVSTEG